MIDRLCPPKVLFIDDDPAARDAFARGMKAAGFDVDVADSGPQALGLATQRRYSVVATDLRMPGMDGLSLIRRMQSLQPAAAFVIVTGLPDVDLKRDDVSDRSIVSIVAKPWEQEDLAATLRTAVALHRRWESSAAGAVSQADDSLSILLIEDNPGDAELVVTYLRRTSLIVAGVDRVERLGDGLERLRATSYDVVIADLTLPDARGLDAVTRLQGAAPDSAIIVLSGLEDDELSVQAVQLGAQDYLTKERVDEHTLERSLRYATERKRAERRLAHLAHHDELTGLTNRSTFRERVDHALARCRRQQVGLGVMFLDLDRFKMINDTMGHDAGDILLAEVATRLKVAVRESDTVARLGGDEFAILLEDLEGPHVPSEIAERVIRAFEEPIDLGAAEVAVTTSIGIAQYPNTAETVEGLLKAADAAMYRAKAAGRNSYRIAQGYDDHGARARLRLEGDMLRAVERDEFLLYYQPQVNLRTARIVAVEALLRWRRPDGTIISPRRIVPLLEDMGLIGRVGEWVLSTACERLSSWQREGRTDLRIAVNLSAQQFDRYDLVGTVDHVLAEWSLEPAMLELEITESTLMRDTRRTNAALDGLKEMGVRIAIDDFGTGYSSLAYLERFAIDTLKIDQSFIRGSGNGEKRASVAGAIVGLGQRLGLDVIAEGVETGDQLRSIQGEGCEVVQGYLVGRPEPEWGADWGVPPPLS